MKIISITTLASGIKKIVLNSPEIASKARPGQFVTLRVHNKGECIPLTIASKNITEGTITLIFQEVGKTTRLLGKLKVGDSLASLTGPLGKPTEIKKFGEVIAIGGGVGIAELLPVVSALKKAQNRVQCIIGARTKDYVILRKEIAGICDNLLIATDDGTLGTKGFVSDVLSEVITDKKRSKLPDLVYAVGPLPMMRVVCEITKTLPQKLNQPPVKTVVSLNPIMVDGTGMCGSCRVTIAGKVKFACVDGPEFDGHQVDWEELETRLKFFSEQEKISIECK